MKKSIAIGLGALIICAGASFGALADGYPDGTPGRQALEDLKNPPAAAKSDAGIQRKNWLPYREGPVDEVQPMDVMPLVKTGDGSRVLPGQKGPIKCDGHGPAGWEAKQGESLQSVLDMWAACEGWTVKWRTDQQYVLQASAVFDGAFIDASSSLVGAFGHANPPAFAEFYGPNKVLVISTPTELDGQ